MIEQSMEKQALAQRIKKMLLGCVGYEGDELDKYRKEAYDYYFQRKRGDEVQGRSEIVTGDLSSMIEANLAQMSEPLLSKRIAEYCAYSEEDEEQAQQEADCVTEMLFKRQNGFLEVVSSIKDAALLRNGVLKVYVDSRTHVQQVRRKSVAPEIVTDVLDKIGATEIHSYDPSTGALSATVTKTTKKFRVESVAPENFLLPKNWHRNDLEDIPFCAERHIEPRSKLIEHGFDKAMVSELRAYSRYGTAADARLPRSMVPIGVAIDSSQDLIEWYECYAKLDDGTGAAQLHTIAFSGSYILDDDDSVDTIGYAIGAVIVNPHTFMGISLYDKLKSTQDTTTAMTRALMDNLNAVNKSRTAHLDGVVEETDLVDGRINNSVRVNPERIQDVRAAISALAVPDTSGNILLNLEHMRRVRSEMGGASLDLATGQMQLNERVGSQGLDRAYSVMEQLAAFMARTIAATLIRQLYLIAHEVLRTQWQEPIQFKRGKEWIKQMPAEWPVRESVVINMGAPLSERQRLSNVLEKLLEKQAMLASTGMEDVLVNVQNYYHAIIQWLRVNDIDMPEKYVVDPRTRESMQALQSKMRKQQEDSQRQDALMQQAIALEQLRSAMEKYKTDAELQFKYYDAVLAAQIEEAKLSVEGIVNIASAKSSGVKAMNGAHKDVTREQENSGATVEKQ